MAQSKKNQTQVMETKPVDCFRVIKQNEKFIIIAGDSRVSINEFNTLDAAVKYINKKPYELIFNTALMMCQKAFNLTPNENLK